MYHNNDSTYSTKSTYNRDVVKIERSLLSHLFKIIIITNIFNDS